MGSGVTEIGCPVDGAVVVEIGLFALQGAITKDLEFCVFDVSPRVPGCPCVEPTSPYMKYKYGIEVGPGRRVAMEIKQAIEEKKLEMIVT